MHGGREKDESLHPQVIVSEENVLTPDTAFECSKVTWSDQKDYDPTGDGIPERFSARVFGPAYDSLLVVFEIHGSDDRLLYRDRWASERYFAYDYRVRRQIPRWLELSTASDKSAVRDPLRSTILAVCVSSRM